MVAKSSLVVDGHYFLVRRRLKDMIGKGYNVSMVGETV